MKAADNDTRRKHPPHVPDNLRDAYRAMQLLAAMSKGDVTRPENEEFLVEMLGDLPRGAWEARRWKMALKKLWKQMSKSEDAGV